jgi:hypothetical protein
MVVGNSYNSDHRPQTAGQQAVRSWPLTVGMLFIAFLCAIGAVALWQNDHGVIAVLPAFLFLGALVKAITSRKSNCPSCNQPVTITSGLCCSGCGAYLILKNNRVSLLGPGDVVDTALFKVDKESLRVPSEWQMPRPGRCCVCGDSATTSEQIEWAYLLKMGYTTMKTLRYKIEMPHCQQHSHGAETDADGIRFRSYDYWQEFKTLNLGKGTYGKDLARLGL